MGSLPSITKIWEGGGRKRTEGPGLLTYAVKDKSPQRDSRDSTPLPVLSRDS